LNKERKPIFAKLKPVTAPSSSRRQKYSPEPSSRG
jgi:hypothetical protein